MSNRIPLIDLSRQTAGLMPALGPAIRRLLRGSRFILGPEVERFEGAWARFCRTRFAVGVASGTDALELALRAAGVGPGDRVATVSFTFVATVDAILHVGAEPLWVDIDPATCTMDPADLERRLRALSPAARRRVRAVIPVHLFGHPCDMTAIGRLARRYRLAVIEDAAQAAGARWRNRPVGGWGTAGCFSFFPSKNLGAFGDGGAIVTDSARIDGVLRRIRIHGRDRQGRQSALGRNSRLDGLQAAILGVKLSRLSGWVARRRKLAAGYRRRLSALPEIVCPVEQSGARHAYGLFVIRTPRRAALRSALQAAGIGAQVYYDPPVHRQPLHRRRAAAVRLPETDRAAREMLALPLYPEMTEGELRRICSVIRRFCSASRRPIRSGRKPARPAVSRAGGRRKRPGKGR